MILAGQAADGDGWQLVAVLSEILNTQGNPATGSGQAKGRNEGPDLKLSVAKSRCMSGEQRAQLVGVFRVSCFSPRRRLYELEAEAEGIVPSVATTEECNDDTSTIEVKNNRPGLAQRGTGTRPGRVWR